MPKLTLVFALLTLGIATRLFPHPPNFTALGAVAIFSGAALRGKLAWLIPLTSVVVSDLLLGFHATAPVIYLNVVAMTMLGGTLGLTSRFLSFAGLGLVSSVLFYLSTNFAVWAEGLLYPPTFDGLVACYVAAIPFFGKMLCADLFYLGALVGGHRLYGAVAAHRIRLSADLRSADK